MFYTIKTRDCLVLSFSQYIFTTEFTFNLGWRVYIGVVYGATYFFILLNTTQRVWNVNKSLNNLWSLWNCVVNCFRWLGLLCCCCWFIFAIFCGTYTCVWKLSYIIFLSLRFTQVMSFLILKNSSGLVTA